MLCQRPGRLRPHIAQTPPPNHHPRLSPSCDVMPKAPGSQCAADTARMSSLPPAPGGEVCGQHVCWVGRVCVGTRVSALGTGLASASFISRQFSWLLPKEGPKRKDWPTSYPWLPSCAGINSDPWSKIVAGAMGLQAGRCRSPWDRRDDAGAGQAAPCRPRDVGSPGRVPCAICWALPGEPASPTQAGSLAWTWPQVATLGRSRQCGQ